VVERRGGPGVATFFVETTPAVGEVVALSEAAARHANVRRLAVGDDVRVVDGAGTVGWGGLHALTKSGANVAVEACETVARPTSLTLLVAVADRDRMLWLAEKATELAITEWRPVMFLRSRSVSPRGEGEAFARKVRARMVSALEQSGGAWLPVVHADRTLEEATDECAEGPRFVLDGSGAPMPAFAPFDATTVMVGPEGGLAAEELDMLLTLGWRAASLGATTLRFETAGVAAAAIIRASQGR
jgi:16S rRNA (uracil1498-N3)-methyltransferase